MNSLKNNFIENTFQVIANIPELLEIPSNIWFLPLWFLIALFAMAIGKLLGKGLTQTFEQKQRKIEPTLVNLAYVERIVDRTHRELLIFDTNNKFSNIKVGNIISGHSIYTSVTGDNRFIPVIGINVKVIVVKFTTASALYRETEADGSKWVRVSGVESRTNNYTSDDLPLITRVSGGICGKIAPYRE